MEVLLLQLDAPLMSFGGPLVDNRGDIQPFPGLSSICGLLANALGYNHGDAAALGALQQRLLIASRADHPGQLLLDYQTVDLGQEFLVDTGWTTRGVPESRGGASSESTHIRYREYWADSVHLLALTLNPSEEAPTLEQIDGALQSPVRPLFLGRKGCLPSCPLVVGRVESPTLREALERYPRHPRADKGWLQAWWPASEGQPEGSRVLGVADMRDWRNQIHTGRRLICEGLVNPPEVTHVS